jgi:phosphatidate cytidylyltransferase
LRLASAAVGLPLLALVVWLGGWPFAIVAGAVAFIAAAEFVHGFLLPSRPLSEAFGLGAGFAGVGLMVMGAQASWAFPVLGIALGLALGAAGFSPSGMFGPRRPLRVLAGAHLYIGIPLASLVLLRDMDDGARWVLLGLLATFAVDTGAYATGKLIGRHKMAPSISPGKTWEGAAGGYVAGAAAAAGLHGLLDLPGSATEVAFLALVLPPIAMVGDLWESFLKRRMGIKDASGFIPGHGGFLDRLDSILFVIPLVYVAARGAN